MLEQWLIILKALAFIVVALGVGVGARRHGGVEAAFGAQLGM